MEGSVGLLAFVSTVCASSVAKEDLACRKGGVPMRDGTGGQEGTHGAALISNKMCLSFNSFGSGLWASFFSREFCLM